MSALTVTRRQGGIQYICHWPTVEPPTVANGATRPAMGAMTICRDVATDEQTIAIRQAAQASGEVWFGPTIWQPRPAFRISVSSWRTGDGDVGRLVALMQGLRGQNWGK